MHHQHRPFKPGRTVSRAIPALVGNNVDILLGHRLRRWPNNKPALGQSLVFVLGLHRWARGKCRRRTVATVPHKNHNYRHISNIRSYVQRRRVADDSATLQSGRYDFYRIRWRYCQLISLKSILYGSHRHTAECISSDILSKPVRSDVWHYII